MSKNSSIKRNRFIRLALSYFLLLIVAVSYTHLTLPTNREV